MPADPHWHASGLHVHARHGDASHVVCRAATKEGAAFIAQLPECVRVANEAADRRADLLFAADRRIDALETAALGWHDTEGAAWFGLCGIGCVAALLLRFATLRAVFR